MSENLIGFGCDLQQKLDAMDPKARKARWAGDIGVELFGIAKKLHRLSLKACNSETTPADDRRERRLMEQARQAASRLGKGVEVYRQPDPRGWPLYVVWPGDVRKGEGIEAYYEQGVAVPPHP